MPTYEYACTVCDKHIEAAQSFADAPLETCAECGGKLRRVFHPVGVLFKGSGFYSTDSKSKKKLGDPSLSKNSDKSPKSRESSAASDAKASGAEAAPPTSAERSSPPPKRTEGSGSESPGTRGD